MKRSMTALAVAAAWAGAAGATTIGYWRFDDPGAANGGAIVSALNAAGNSDLDGAPSGGPLYSASVPGPFIYDPVAGITNANTFALDATTPNARINVNGNSAGDPMDTASFTIEGFIRLDLADLPASFISFVSRRGGSNPYGGWQVDYNALTYSGGGDNPNAGKIRARFDTMTNTVAYLQNQTIQGNLIDDGEWHHFALSYNAVDNRVVFFTDYTTNSTRLLTGPLSNQVSMAFGALSTFNVWMDEVRYSDSALGPDEFLVAIPEPGVAGLLVAGAALLARRCRRQ